MRTILIILAIVTCSACNPARQVQKALDPVDSISRKEMRDANRANRILQHAIRRAERISPGISSRDTTMIPIKLIYPGAIGTIMGPALIRPDVRARVEEAGDDIESLQWIIQDLVETHCLDEPVYFEDDTISARISLVDGIFMFDYTIKPQAVKGLVPCVTQQINPIVYKRMPLKWWQTCLMVIGTVFLIYAVYWLYITRN